MRFQKQFWCDGYSHAKHDSRPSLCIISLSSSVRNYGCNIIIWFNFLCAHIFSVLCCFNLVINLGNKSLNVGAGWINQRSMSYLDDKGQDVVIDRCIANSPRSSHNLLNTYYLMVQITSCGRGVISVIFIVSLSFTLSTVCAQELFRKESLQKCQNYLSGTGSRYICS